VNRESDASTGSSGTSECTHVAVSKPVNVDERRLFQSNSNANLYRSDVNLSVWLLFMWTSSAYFLRIFFSFFSQIKIWRREITSKWWTKRTWCSMRTSSRIPKASNWKKLKLIKNPYSKLRDNQFLILFFSLFEAFLSPNEEKNDDLILVWDVLIGFVNIFAWSQIISLLPSALHSSTKKTFLANNFIKSLSNNIFLFYLFRFINLNLNSLINQNFLIF